MKHIRSEVLGILHISENMAREVVTELQAQLDAPDVGRSMTGKQDEWKRGGKQHVLNAYAKLHEGRLGAHWIWVALERIAEGEPESVVLRDYGYEFEPKKVRK